MHENPDQGMVEIPVPPLIFVGSTKERLHKFRIAAIACEFEPTAENFTELKKAWSTFTPDERRELGFAKSFRKLRRLHSYEIRFPFPVIQRYIKEKQIETLRYMISGVTRMEVDIVLGRVHFVRAQPSTILVDANAAGAS